MTGMKNRNYYAYFGGLSL